MSFEHAWILALAWLPLAWVALEWRHSGLRFGLLAKGLALAAILVALAGPVLTVAETKMAVTVLVDTSESVTAADLARASEIAGRIESTRGRHWIRLIPFARETRTPTAEEWAGGWKLRRTAGEAGRGTDLERAVTEAIGASPAGLVPRLVLISDGLENRGSVARAAWQARQLGIPIDTYAMAGRSRPALRLDSVSLPSLVFSGERFPIDLVVQSPRPGAATVEVTAEGKSLGANPVALEAGENRFRVHASIKSAGIVELTGAIRAEGLGEVRFAQAIALRRPRVLYVSMDPPGTEAHLVRALEASYFDIRRAASPAEARLEDFQVVAFNNWDLESLPPARKPDLESFVREGGGLLVIGGERNVYVEDKALEDNLERALPAKLAPPRSPEGTCVVLIVDKSSSMEGKKIELARLAAIGVVENLRAVDRVGVLIFDNSFQWAVPIRKAEDRTLIKRLIAGIMPDGGTQIAPALAEAYRRIAPLQATFKHIVLLTDGISEEGDSLALAKESATHKVTISTVGLGQDVNRAYLEKVAGFALGKAYFLVDPSGLEQILLRDVLEHTGSTAVEKPITPVVARQAEILEGVGMEAAPALKGYVKFIAKPGADTILKVDPADPLLVRWQYGLGRSAVFASDAKSRWAADWIGWKGYDRFWNNVFHDLLPHSQLGEAELRYDSAGGDLVAEYRLARNLPEPPAVPDVYVIGPRDFRRPVPVKKVAQGTYQGRVQIGGRQGLFRVRPLEESRAFPEVGIYRQEKELSEYGSNAGLLQQISAFTGGRFQPQPAAVFDPAGRSVPGTMRLWPGLLALAILLNLAELVRRKWKGLLEAVGLRKYAMEG